MIPARTHRQRRATWSNQRGTSLIETCVALGLFALVAATMSDFLVEHVRRSSSNNLYSVAYSLAAEALEGARALAYADIADRTTTHQEGGVNFNVATTVQTDRPKANLKTVTATVTWNEQDGQHQVSIPVVYTEIRRL